MSSGPIEVSSKVSPPSRETHAKLSVVGGAAVGLPVLDRGAHVGHGGDALCQQGKLRLAKGGIPVLGTHARESGLDERRRRIDEDARRCL